MSDPTKDRSWAPEATHLPQLLRCLLMPNLTHPIVEMGMGLHSTPAIARYSNNRIVWHFDNDPSWSTRALDEAYPKGTPSSAHVIIVHDNDWEKLEPFPASILLVDQWPSNTRVPVAIRWLCFADIIICHDWEDIENHKWNELYEAALGLGYELREDWSLTPSTAFFWRQDAVGTAA